MSAAGRIPPGHPIFPSARRLKEERDPVTNNPATYSDIGFTTLVTPASNDCEDVTVTTGVTGGKLRVRLEDAQGVGEGTRKRCDFQFAVFKDQ